MKMLSRSKALLLLVVTGCVLLDTARALEYFGYCYRCTDCAPTAGSSLGTSLGYTSSTGCENLGGCSLSHQTNQMPQPQCISIANCQPPPPGFCDDTGSPTSPTAPSPTSPTAPSPTSPTAPSPTSPTAPSPTSPGTTHFGWCYACSGCRGPPGYVLGSTLGYTTDDGCESPIGGCSFEHQNIDMLQPECIEFSGCQEHILCNPSSSPTTTSSPTTAPTPAPTTEPKIGVYGDPHFTTWKGTRFSYHGECDLVLVHSDSFGDGLGLDIHIRTVIKDSFSFIKSAAVKIGNDTFEITKGKYWINGVEGVELPTTLSTFDLVYYPPGSSFGNKKHAKRVLYLGNGDYISFGNTNDFVAVITRGGQENFGDSVGLLGDFETGIMLGRDGVTMYDRGSVDDFGAEWQVRPDEQNLFQVEGNPLEGCRLPTKTATRRLLRQHSAEFVANAEMACVANHDHPDDVDSCLFDVFATGDLDMAEQS